ncbi:MAG: protein kinase, partial [Planctomycetota bacterium]
MSSEHTEQQSTDDLIKSRDLSLESISPPAQIAGYTIQKCVGQGAYGEVWSGISRKTGRKVAIKFYTRRSSSDVQMLAAEVEKLAVIGTDRYVVQLLDVGWDSEPPYYVMDYIEHGSLEDRLKEDDTIAPSEAIEIFQEIATGMMHLHSKGILHCDLKPGNVLLDQDGKPRLADFGQSRLGDDDTPALGTLFYMAPEQADTEAAPDARWDVYGLGALFYSMLTGRPPYYREDLAREIEQTVDLPSRLATYRQGLQTAPLPDDHRKIPGVDRALADIIDQCISADRKGRFGSVQSVLLALKQREESRARRPVMLLGLIGPLLLTAVISLFGWWAIRQAVSDAVEAVTNKAEYTNQFAAELGAANAGAMFDQYFLSIDRLLNEEEFKEHFKELVSEETLPLRLAVSDPVDNKKKDFEARQALVQRMKEDSSIQAMLNERVNNFYGRYPTSASWFVCDTFGNQLVSAFWDPDTGCVLEDEDTLGKNWSYRTYFTALSSDLNQETGYEGVSRDPFQRTMITAPHISTYFQSKQSGTLKVAFSAPIEDNG